MLVREITILVHVTLIASCSSLIHSHNRGRVPSTFLQAMKAKESVTFDETKADFCRGYLNKHHSDVLCLFAEAYSELGIQQSKRNSFSGGSWKIVGAQVTAVCPQSIDLEVSIKDRSKSGLITERVVIPMDADVLLTNKRGFVSLPRVPEMENDVDNLVRKMNRLCNQVKRPEVTGKLIQMGIQFGSVVGELKDDMYLNQVPHNRYVRQYFYDMAADAALEAVVQCSEGTLNHRMKMVAMFPEMNPSMDSYR
jgi:hypothetical protein